MQREENDMKKTLLICLMILGLTAGCASTGSDKGEKSKAGENIPEGAINADEMEMEGER